MLTFLKANPYTILGAIVGVILLSTVSYFTGVSHEKARQEARLEKEARKATENVLKKGQELSTKKDTAEEAARKTKVIYREKFVPVEKKVIEYVQTPAAAVPCFTPDEPGAVLMREAIEAANSALAESAQRSR